MVTENETLALIAAIIADANNGHITQAAALAYIRNTLAAFDGQATAGVKIVPGLPALFSED
jgi:hypothetical protein